MLVSELGIVCAKLPYFQKEPRVYPVLLFEPA